MKLIECKQGTPEWHEHRATHHNASDAPAIMGVSPYKTRSQLLKERATGATQEIDPHTQKRFDDGHRFEALARPFAEAEIGDELFPCVGTEGKLSASFDGLTMNESIAWECKTLNDDLRAAMKYGCEGSDLPLHYQIQMEQQCMVSGCEKVLFTACKFDADGNLIEERHCWYFPNDDLAERIIAGWAQFEADLADYQPEPVTAAPVAAPVEGFGALSLRVEGRVLASNMDDFRASAEAFIDRLPKPADLQTDQDFANAESAVKACADAESRIKSAKEAAIAQMADVDAVLRAADTIDQAIRAARLALDKAVKAEKENRKAAALRLAADAVKAHIAGINSTMQGYEMNAPASLSSDLATAIKGLKSLDSIRAKLDGAVAQAKITASQEEGRRRQCIAVIEKHSEHKHLLPDARALVDGKSPDDLANLIAARVADHQAKQEAERERIRAEEQAKAQREAEAQQANQVEPPAATVRPAAPTEPPKDTGARIKLGHINALICPLSITADGLAQLGIQPVGTERAAKLYRASDLQRILRTLADHIQAAMNQKIAA